MGKGRRSHNDQRANLRGKGFVAIPHVVMESSAWQHASLRARCILLELVKRHNGYNNGRIAMSQREMSVAIGSTSFRDIARATAEMMELGFVSLQWEGDTWARKAREFRITWLPTGEHPHQKPATDDWKAFSGATTVSAAKAVSATTVSAARKFPATTVSAAKEQKWRKTVTDLNGAATTVSAHICKPYPAAAEQAGEQGVGPSSSPSESTTLAAAPRFDTETSRLQVEETTATVLATLLAKRKATGPAGVSEVARKAGVSAERVIAFLDGRDGLSAPIIAHLNRALNTTAGRLPFAS